MNKFKKAVVVGIKESFLDIESWQKIDGFVDSKVFVSPESPEYDKHLSDADCLLVNFGVKVNREDIDKASHLQYIGVLATAYGKIDVEYAKEKGVIVSNLAGYSTNAVAEFVLAVVLEHIRQLEEGKKRGKQGNYSEAGMEAIEIKDKVFAIIGLGKIGGRVAELALGFGADVRFYDKVRKPELESRGVKYQGADELILQADFLSLNLPQTKETEGFLSAQRIQSLKTGAIVINTAPMELVDIDALVERLAKGDITFILDHSDEMRKEDLGKLSQYQNCITYPPIAYITAEARSAMQHIFLSNIEGFLKGSPVNTVN